MPRFTDIGSYLNGFPTGDNKGVLVLSIDEMSEKKLPHSIIIVWEDGKFLSTSQKGWRLADLTNMPNQDKTVLILGSYGKYLVKNNSVETNETINGSGISINDRGPLKSLTTIEDKVYVVGGDRQAYQLDENNEWKDISNNQLSLSSDDNKIFSLESISGFSSSEIYAVGLRGEIWLYNSEDWKNIKSPTNFMLNTVCCAENGVVYVAGQGGTLLKGRNDYWQVIDLKNFKYDIWDLCWFKGDLYISTMTNIYRLNNDSLVQVECDIQTANKLVATENVMWSIGAKDVMSFDGITWTRID